MSSGKTLVTNTPPRRSSPFLWVGIISLGLRALAPFSALLLKSCHKKQENEFRKALVAKILPRHLSPLPWEGITALGLRAPARFRILTVCSAFCIILIFPLLVCAKEIKSRYVTLQFNSQSQLTEFNEQIELGRKLDSYVRKKNIVTVEDEVLAKVDTIIEKAETILEMFPDKLHITICLLDTAGQVSKMFKDKYGKAANHIAYYSLSEDTIYISINDSRLEVLAHEIGHAVVDHYFKVRPPYNVHELMAQFVEKRIAD